MWSVVFVLLSYLDGDVVKGDPLSVALDAEKESKEIFGFCAKMSPAGGNFLAQVSDGAEVVRSELSPAGELVNCAVIADRARVKSFARDCRSARRARGSGWQPQAPFTRVGEAKRLCREFKQTAERTGESERGGPELRDKVVRRSKRGFTYPGTLWCGAGNMADHDEQLGEFAETDSCCRTHDHCPHVIHAFSSKYGYTNFKWHSICHCDCDNALKTCLRKVNDTSSRVVGQAFFNVIGAPCFEFVYEERCAERHWYGMCKRYEKLPIAVLKEAVPYDFGGIDVIDELTVAPPRKKDSKKGENPESTTQPPMSGPDEPSLRNVVTAAEDFIKVLATVSTSQSSTADSSKGESQSSEKKRRKNGKKNKVTKKRKEKGKGRKRKQKAGAAAKVEEAAAVSPSGSRAEEVAALSNFISESRQHGQSGRNTHRVGDGEYELRGKEEASNEVMKDEPAMEKEAVPNRSPSRIRKRPAGDAAPAPPPAVIPYDAKKRKERRKKKVALPSTVEVVSNSTDGLPTVSVPAIITTTPATKPRQQSLTEKRPVVSTASAPIVIPKVKRNRSKERGEREGRKKRRKVRPDSSIEAAAHKNSYVDNLKVIPVTGAPTVTSVASTAPRLVHRPDTFGGRMPASAATLNASFSVLKRQRSKERGRGRKRKKPVSPLPSDQPVLRNGSENTLRFLRLPDTEDILKSPAATALGRPAEGRPPPATEVPSITTRSQRPTIRAQRKLRKKAASADLTDGVSIPAQTEHTTTALSATAATATATPAALYMSPIQLSVERAREQFSRKKRRKAAMSDRQQ